MKNFRFFPLIFAATVLLFLTSCAPKAPQYPKVPELTVFCLGDSITSGFKMMDPVRNSFPSQLQRMSGYKWKVINGGAPGATAIKKGDLPIWKQKPFAEIKRVHPELVILILGTNDAKDKNWKNIKSFKKDYTKLVQLLKDLPSSPEVVVCAVPPIHTSHYGITDQRAKLLTEKVKEIALATSTRFIDIASPLAGKPQFFLDGLHPNKQGAKMIAETIIRAY